MASRRRELLKEPGFSGWGPGLERTERRPNGWELLLDSFLGGAENWGLGRGGDARDEEIRQSKSRSLAGD